MSKTIILTGGGTAGHVTPNLALLPGLKERGFQIRYIGSIDGMEKGLIEKAGIPYDGVKTGKFRRYLSLKNLTDIFNVIAGIFQAGSLIRKHKPDVVFSKGGFVSVPTVVSAWFRRIPVIVHESDMTPGLANKICFPFATKVCCTFPETLNHLPKKKGVLSGSPIRSELLSGSREAGLAFAGFTGEKPVLLMTGGSLGSQKLNAVLRGALPKLLPDYDIIHLCGRKNLDSNLVGTPGYVQFEYVSEEMKDIFAAADIIFSRAGSNAICEILALRKPNFLVPLSRAASRGDQILNAHSFEKQGFSSVVEEEALTEDVLVESLHALSANRETYISAMEKSNLSDGVSVILDLIDELTR